jgi:hypothetical protein
VLVLGGTVGVALLEACEVLSVALLMDDIICRTLVSVDCHRICIMSAHTVGLGTVATSIVTRLGFSGIAPSASAEVEYTSVSVPAKVLPQKRPFGSELGPVPTKKLLQRTD